MGYDREPVNTLNKEYVFPNPYVAKLFVKFVETKADLNVTKKKPNLLN